MLSSKHLKYLRKSTRIVQSDHARLLLQFLISLTILLFTACAKQPLPIEEYATATDPMITALQEHIASYTEWDAQVRIALKHNKLSWRGVMLWTQREDSFRMVFNDLFGRRLMLIESLQDGSVLAIDSEGHHKQAANASTLIRLVLGSEMSLDNLHYWLLGVPAPNRIYANLKLDEEGRLQSYEQDDWTVDYTAYNQDDCVRDLPSNITLSHADTQLWLYIRSWHTPQNVIKTSTCRQP